MAPFRLRKARRRPFSVSVPPQGRASERQGRQSLGPADTQDGPVDLESNHTSAIYLKPEEVGHLFGLTPGESAVGVELSTARLPHSYLVLDATTSCWFRCRTGVTLRLETGKCQQPRSGSTLR